MLAARPVGAPRPQDFRLEEVAAPEAGEVALETLWLSLDPYMRGRMNDGPSYAAPLSLGEVMTGEMVSRVIASRLEAFAPGDLVLAPGGWQSRSAAGREGLMKLDPRMERPSLALGVAGMTGFTAYVGLRDIGAPQPGETVVVGAASGAVGLVVGQIARLEGARSVGVAGDPKKCGYVTGELASTPASTGARLTSPRGCRRPVRTGSTPISRASAARCRPRRCP